MEEDRFLKFDESSEVAMYIAFKRHMGKGIKNDDGYQKSMHSLIDNYSGPEIYFDFDSSGRLIGIEILGD